MKINENTPFFTSKVFNKDSTPFVRVKQHKGKTHIETIAKKDMSFRQKIYKVFSDLFGVELRKISKVLRSTEGQAIISHGLTYQNKKANLKYINTRIEKLNKRMFFLPKVKTIQLPSPAPVAPKKKANKPKPAPAKAKSITPAPAEDPAKPETPAAPAKPAVPAKVAKPKAKKGDYPVEYLKAFYRNEGVDSENRKISKLWSYDDAEKESHHNYIQWLFPLTEPSAFNSKAPVLTPEVISELKKDPVVLAHMEVSFKQMLRFYGLKMRDDGSIVRTHSFPEKSKNWLTPGNHNHLRISRMLKSLRLFGMEKEAQAFHARLMKIHQQYPKQITDTTIKFWNKDVA